MCNQKLHLSWNLARPAVEKPRSSTTNSRPDVKGGTPGTLLGVNFIALGSPVMKNECIAPYYRIVSHIVFCTPIMKTDGPVTAYLHSLHNGDNLFLGMNSPCSTRH